MTKSANDPWCMLTLAIAEQAKRDAQRGDEKAVAWFNSKDYLLCIDIINIFMGLDLPYDLKPTGIN